MVDNLLFEKRCAQRGGSTGRVAEIFEDFLFLAGELAQLLEQRTLHLVIADLNAGLFANLGENQTEADATLGELAIFGSRFLFRRVFIGEGLAGLLQVGVDLAPDVLELGIDEALGRIELIEFVELVESWRLTFWRVIEPNWLSIWPRTISFSLSTDSRPSFVASSSLISIGAAAATSLTVMSKVASLPARLAAG